MGLGTDCANRATADISADADPATGLAVYDTLGQSGWQQVGGTSLASPLVAAMYALAGDPPPGTYPVTYPYAHGGRDLNDVTQGSDGVCGDVLCNAGPGWDGPTGLGTPDGVAALTAGASAPSPGRITTGSAATPLADASVVLTGTAQGDASVPRPTRRANSPCRCGVGDYTETVTDFGYHVRDRVGRTGHQGTDDHCEPRPDRGPVHHGVRHDHRRIRPRLAALRASSPSPATRTRPSTPTRRPARTRSSCRSRTPTTSKPRPSIRAMRRPTRPSPSARAR